MIGWNQYSPIGLDLGIRSIKAVQTSGSGASRILSGTALIPRKTALATLDSSEVAFLRETLDRRGFPGNDVVIAAPADKLRTELLELPPRSSGAPLEQMAFSELARAAKLEIGSFEMGRWDLPMAARTSGTTMMATALPHTDADALLDSLEDYGFNVVGIDVSYCAVLRACTPLLSGTGDTTAILDLGWSAARLILVRGGVVVYQRTLPECGGRALRESMVKQFEIDADLADHFVRTTDSLDTTDRIEGARGQIASLVERHAELLCAELRASFAYTRHRYQSGPIESLILVGGDAGTKALPVHLAQQLQLRVEVANLSKLLTGEPFTEGLDAGVFTIALGLASY